MKFVTELQQLRERCEHFESLAARQAVSLQVSNARGDDLDKRLRAAEAAAQRYMRSNIEMQAQYGLIQAAIQTAGEAVRHAARLTGGGQFDEAPTEETANDVKSAADIAQKFKPRIES